MKRISAGFTLIEMIVSFSLLVIILSALFFAVGQGMRAWRKAALKSEKQQVAGLVMERICRDVRAASEILSCSNTKEVVLKIGSETVGYQLVGQKVRRAKGKSAAYLTDENEIEALSFSYPLKDLVEIKLEEGSACVSLRN